jgi:glucosamine--fructose-6-phosphate aminotransferase (isomerizing)
MLDEAREAPAAVARLLAADRDGYASLGAELQAAPPQSLLTIARGSSDHAAHYMAYLIMARLGRLVTSLPMSLITLYQSRLQCDGLVSFAFSQSGQSHDLVVPTRFFRDGGARTVAVVNDMASPLAHAAQWTFDLHAGVETSVAATKSYIAQLVAGARVVAAWQATVRRNARPMAFLALQRAAEQHWQRAIDTLADADRLLVRSAAGWARRGDGSGACKSLKCAESRPRHSPARNFSTGQWRSLTKATLVVFAPRGPVRRAGHARRGHATARGPRARRAGSNAGQCVAAGRDGRGGPRSDRGDPELYPMVEALARARGVDPDAPRHLAKVTLTLTGLTATMIRRFRRDKPRRLPSRNKANCAKLPR